MFLLSLALLSDIHKMITGICSTGTVETCSVSIFEKNVQNDGRIETQEITEYHCRVSVMHNDRRYEDILVFSEAPKIGTKVKIIYNPKTGDITSFEGTANSILIGLVLMILSIVLFIIYIGIRPPKCIR